MQQNKRMTTLERSAAVAEIGTLFGLKEDSLDVLEAQVQVAKVKKKILLVIKMNIEWQQTHSEDVGDRICDKIATFENSHRENRDRRDKMMHECTRWLFQFEDMEQLVRLHIHLIHQFPFAFSHFPGQKEETSTKKHISHIIPMASTLIIDCCEDNMLKVCEQNFFYTFPNFSSKTPPKYKPTTVYTL
jgi:hypothetical protein